MDLSCNASFVFSLHLPPMSAVSSSSRTQQSPTATVHGGSWDTVNHSWGVTLLWWLNTSGGSLVDTWGRSSSSPQQAGFPPCSALMCEQKVNKQCLKPNSWPCGLWADTGTPSTTSTYGPFCRKSSNTGCMGKRLHVCVTQTEEIPTVSWTFCLVF